MLVLPNSQYGGHELTEFLIEHKITVLYSTAALLTTIERDVHSLRALFILGGVCPPSLISRWSQPRRRILNTYGSPETTVMATWCELFPDRPVTIGSPLPTCQIYLLDDQLRPVKDGEIGEICIGGPGVAMGYLNRPDLTKERFIANPIVNDRKMMPHLYRTGDLGRITPAGEVEYLGQINTLVKIQGHRIELGEMEQMALLFASTLPLNQYPTIPRFENEASTEPKSKRSRLSILKQLSIKNIYQKIMTDPLYKNSIFNMASTFISGVLGYIFWIMVARLYKAEDVGIATTLISVMTLLGNFTILGFNVSLNRYLPKSTHKNDLINSSFVITTFAAIIASAIFLLGLLHFRHNCFFYNQIFSILSLSRSLRFFVPGILLLRVFLWLLELLPTYF